VDFNEFNYFNNLFKSKDYYNSNSIQIAESIILATLDIHLKKQGKEFVGDYSSISNSNRERRIMFGFDGYAPDGFDDFVGKTVFEIKLYRSKELDRYKKVINDFAKRVLINEPVIDNIIFVFMQDFETNEMKEILSGIEEFTENNRNTKKIRIEVWDKRKINQFFELYKEEVVKLVHNLNSFMLDKYVERSIRTQDEQWRVAQSKNIDSLRHEFQNGDLVLYLGAGVSRKAKIPTWDELVTDMYLSLLKKRLNDQNIPITNEDKEVLLKQLLDINSESPLLQARFLRTGLDKEFASILSEVLYKKCTYESDLLTELSKLCMPIRNATGIHAVITYNFDDLLEYFLRNDEIKHKTIYRESDFPNRHELGIYHVHGFLPKDSSTYTDLTENLLVFSEEGYHNLYSDPYNWSNMIQLTMLNEKTGLFIGLSMTDPNLRRLLEISVKKQKENGYKRHYAILPLSSIGIHKDTRKKNVIVFEKTIRDIQEEYFSELGINIIWISDFDEIPALIKRIRD
jgi:hypothetical protein